MSDTQVTESRDWGDFLRSSSDTGATEQPVTDSDSPVDQEEVEQSVEEVNDSVEAVEEQPETESEVETLPFNDDTEIEMGEDRKAVKLSELKNGYLRQSDYTKKSQELATQRKEFESQVEKLKPIQEWSDYMDANPWVFQQIDAALREFHSTGTLPIQEALQDSQYGQYINHLMAENSKLKKELDGVKGEYEGVKLTSEMTRLQDELKADYGDLVTKDYMQSLQERAKQDKLSFDVLKDIAEGQLAKQKLKSQPTSKQIEAKAVQKMQETRKSAPSTPKPSAQVPAKADNVNREGGWGDFFRSFK